MRFISLKKINSIQAHWVHSDQNRIENKTRCFLCSLPKVSVKCNLKGTWILGDDWSWVSYSALKSKYKKTKDARKRKELGDWQLNSDFWKEQKQEEGRNWHTIFSHPQFSFYLFVTEIQLLFLSSKPYVGLSFLLDVLCEQTA